MNSRDNTNTAESGDEEEDEEEDEEDGKPVENEHAEKLNDTECESMEVDGCARAKGPGESNSNTGVQNDHNTNDAREHDGAASEADRVMNGETVQNSDATVGQNDVQPAESTKSKRAELSSEDNTGTG